MENLTTYGCFGDGNMCKLNRAADLSKVQQWVKVENNSFILDEASRKLLIEIIGYHIPNNHPDYGLAIETLEQVKADR